MTWKWMRPQQEGGQDSNLRQVCFGWASVVGFPLICIPRLPSYSAPTAYLFYIFNFIHFYCIFICGFWCCLSPAAASWRLWPLGPRTWPASDTPDEYTVTTQLTNHNLWLVKGFKNVKRSSDRICTVLIIRPVVFKLTSNWQQSI